MDTAHGLIELGASAIDGMAVVFIVGTFLWATVRFAVHIGRQASNPFERFKLSLGRALSLGLEFLVAADVIRTVTTAPTFASVGMLGAIILIRTFLSWSLVVEMEGRWPWQAARIPSAEERV